MFEIEDYPKKEADVHEHRKGGRKYNQGRYSHYISSLNFVPFGSECVDRAVSEEARE